MNAQIPREVFRFFGELARHNDRAWFEANKARYVQEVRDPLLRFVEAFGPRLARISRHMVADPRPSGGSLFRIYRDTRFSRDKVPYKTHAGLHFRHAAGRDVHAPVFYLHLQPGSVFTAAGLWRPEPEAVKAVRDAIVAHPDRWMRAIRACPLSHGEDSLKRPPRGYPADHPLVEDLKRQTFITHAPFTEKQACAPDFVDRFAEACRRHDPLMRFLTAALGLPW
jgi:uncharacterized protein (TIGR02453 family)